jgi:hypothetical protein
MRIRSSYKTTQEIKMFFEKAWKFLAAACLSVTLSAQTSTSSSTITHALPPVGLAATETLQINLLNTAAASSSGTAASCTGSVSFANATGTAIGSATSFTISSGEVVSVTLPFAKSGLTARGEIVPSFTLTITSGTPCALSTSLETYDTSSGVTHVYTAGGGFGFGGPGGGGPGPGGR